jgi:CHAT domain-containing protein/tetratricopeptide (TPR) repeat protein
MATESRRPSPRWRTGVWPLLVLACLLCSRATPQPPEPGAAGREADRLFAEGLAATGRQDLDTAGRRFAEALVLAETDGDKRRIARVLNGLAGVGALKGDPEQAVRHAERAQALLDEVGTPAEQAGNLPVLGVAYQKAGRLERAMQVYERAVASLDARTAPLRLAAVQLILAQVRERAGRLEEALQLYSESASVLVRGRQWRPAVQAAVPGGRLALRLGRRPAAREQFALALGAAISGGTPEEIADTLSLLIPLLAEDGEWDQVFTLMSQAREALLQRGDPLRAAALLAVVGHQFILFGQPQRGQDYLAEAGRLVDELKEHPRQDSVAYLRGFVRMFRGRPDLAAGDFQHALEKGRGVADAASYADWRQSLGMAYLNQGDARRAREEFLRALKLTEALPGTPGLATRWHTLAVTSYRLGEFRRALEEAARAAPGFPPGSQGYHTIAYHGLRALCHLELGEMEPCLEALKAAQAATDATGRALRFAPDLATFQSVQPVNLAATTAYVLFRQGKTGEALAALEKAHGAGLARWAGDPEQELARLLKPADRDRLGEARRVLLAARQVTETLAARRGGDAEERATVRRRLEEAEGNERVARVKLAELETELRARYPAAWRLAEPPGVGPEDLVARAAAHPDTLYLSWALVDARRAVLFALSKRAGVRGFVLPVGGLEVLRRAETWRASLAERRAAEPAQAAAAWKEWLGPAEAAGLLSPRSGYRRLVLVAEGPLHDIPLAALADGQGKRLIERFPVASALSILPPTAPPAPGKAEKGVLCAADPSGRPGETPAPAQTALRAGLGALRHARVEAAHVARAFPGSVLLEGPAAREARWKAECGRFQVLHFATHGVVVPQAGLSSWLLLAPEPADSPEDGRLEAREVLSQRLSARLAVLSACETGRGQAAGGDGLLGLAWAFQAAGCAAVVASRWQVDDAATADLVGRLYRRLRAGARKDEALRDAMLGARAQPGRAHPYYWAAFQVIGDTAPLTTPARPPGGAGRAKPKAPSPARVTRP